MGRSKSARKKWAMAVLDLSLLTSIFCSPSSCLFQRGFPQEAGFHLCSPRETYWPGYGTECKEGHAFLSYVPVSVSAAASYLTQLPYFSGGGLWWSPLSSRNTGPWSSNGTSLFYLSRTKKVVDF